MIIFFHKKGVKRNPLHTQTNVGPGLAAVSTDVLGAFLVGAVPVLALAGLQALL